MFSTQEEVEATLAAQCYVFALGQSLLGNEPSQELFASLDARTAKQVFEVMGLSEVETQDIHQLLSGAASRIDALKSAYTKLFIGPTKLAAPPWESVYRTQGRVILNQITLDVRNAYRSQGFLPQAYPSVADDHIAIELGFLALLSQRALQKLQAQDQSWQNEVYECCRFLEDHVLTWAERYSTDLLRAEKSLPRQEEQDFYGIIVHHLLSAIKNDVSFLKAMDNRTT